MTSEIGRNLKKLLDESEVYKGNAKKLSLDSGLGESFVRDIIRGQSGEPKVENLMSIAKQLGCGVEEIDPTIDPSTGRRRSGRTPPIRQGNTIPIRNAGSIVGYTQRPTSLARVINAYAIYMVGNEMELRYDQGWLLYVNPLRPPSRGRDVAVFGVDGSVLVRRFIEQTASDLVLEQLNPRQEVRISLEGVREVHLIVGSDQEGG